MRGADRQLELLERLQALLRESKYTTTYKFALLHALCDLALELPVGQHTVPLEKVARRVIDLYWQQVVPFQVPRGRSMVALKQSTGGPAAAVALVTQWRKQHRTSAGVGALLDGEVDQDEQQRELVGAGEAAGTEEALRLVRKVRCRSPLGAPPIIDHSPEIHRPWLQETRLCLCRLFTAAGSPSPRSWRLW